MRIASVSIETSYGDIERNAMTIVVMTKVGNQIIVEHSSTHAGLLLDFERVVNGVFDAFLPDRIMAGNRMAEVFLDFLFRHQRRCKWNTDKLSCTYENSRKLGFNHVVECIGVLCSDVN